MAMLISAIVPTYNRASYLGQAIQSLTSQTLPAEQYEIIVVDNCSTDDTRRVVGKQLPHVANLRYNYEPIQGLNRARNMGWRAASGTYVAFMDDDAVANPDWLERILCAFDTYLPTPACVGGRVDPLWEASRPYWLSDSILVMLSIIQLERRIVLAPGQWLVGTNIAFPRRVLAMLGGFPEKLGRRGSSLISNDEIVVERILDDMGEIRLYHPDICVRHLVTSARVTKRHFLHRAFWQGVSESLTELLLQPLSPCCRVRLGLYRMRVLLSSPEHVRNLIFASEDPDRFEARCNVFSRLGNALGMLGIAR